MGIVSEFPDLFGTGFSQHARLVTLASAQERFLLESLMVERFSGQEAVNGLYAFDVDALSISTDLDLTLFIGEEMTIALLQSDGSRRAWHGLCTQASWLGADGGAARYRLRLEPALTLLSHRRDSYIFQDMDAREIVTELLADYAQVRFEFDISQELPRRKICTQYRESDLEFLTRLLVSEGLSWRYEHDRAAEIRQGDGQARHKVIIFDSAATLPPLAGGDRLRFHGVRAADTDDAIDAFHARRQLQPNAVSISAWDPLQLMAPSAERSSSLDAGAVPTLALYDGSAERSGHSSAEADARSERMLQAFELENKQFTGAGAVRRLAPGHVFVLTQHEHYPDAAFTVLSVKHEARNNCQTGIAGAPAAGLEPGTYRNSFVCVRREVAIVPPVAAALPQHMAAGPQTALVVGLDSSVVTGTRDHQVKVQFSWQRGQRTNAGGIAHDTDPQGNAPGDETCGTWVRVAEALAGPNWGTQFTPRLGTEVLVDFIEGDMDSPVVVAQLYTGADVPPFSAGVDAGVNHRGVLSGIHSHNFHGGGFNQWQLDDSPGQLSTRLATSSAASRLQLGYLVAQAPPSAQRGAYRGSGFELRTDAWAVVRGGAGVLLSATSRPQQGSGVESTQMDVAEAVSLAEGAADLGRRLGDSASQQQALFSTGAMETQASIISQINPQDKGKHAATVNGQGASKAGPGTRELDAGQPVEQCAAPLVLLESPASVNWATPASTVMYAGEYVQWSSQSDLHLAAAHAASSVAAHAASLFASQGGVQACAANGPLSLQAHTDQLEILAHESVTVVSVNDTIQITAKDTIVLQAGQSSITLEGGAITFACPGALTVKGGEHALVGGASHKAQSGKLPDSRLKLFDEAFILKDKTTGLPFANQAYRIKRADGSLEDGITDAAGKTHLVKAAEAEPLDVALANVFAAPVPYDEQIQFKNVHDAVLPNVRYEIKFDDGTVAHGVTDAQGKTSRVIAHHPMTMVEAKLQMLGPASCCGSALPSTDALTVPLAGVSVNQVDVGTSVVQVKTPEGKSRRLTAGEIRMAQVVFGNAIDYSKVKVHNGEYLWFGLQPDNTVMAPNGEIYYNPTMFKPDFFQEDFFQQITFIHEMTHVWQHQLGYPVKWRGALRIGLDYAYTLADGKTLSDYNMEAQGNIVSDYWAMKTLGANLTWIHEEKHVNDRHLFEKVLAKFIADPADRSNLPGG